MRPQVQSKRAMWAGTVVAIALGTELMGGSAQAANVPTMALDAGMSISVDHGSVKLVSQHRFASGARTATWTVDGESVVASGTGSAKVVVRHVGHAGGKGAVEVALIPTPEAASSTPAGNDRASADAVKVVNPTLAKSMSASMTSARVSPMVTKGQTYRSWCVSTSGDAGNANAKACDVQTLGQISGNDWYIGDAVSVTGQDSDWYYDLTKLVSYVSYGAGNTSVKWTPTTTLSTGTCQNTVLGLSYGGVVLQQQFNRCPDKYGPSSMGTAQFGAEWNGETSDVRGFDYENIDHKASNGSPTATLHLSMNWA